MRVLCPVPLGELIALYHASKPLKAMEFKAAVLQAARSESAGWYHDDILTAAILLYPLPGSDADHREVLFVARGPGLQLAPIVRFARLMLPALPDDVRLTVHARTSAGARLARMCGFRATRGDAWEWRRNWESSSTG